MDIENLLSAIGGILLLDLVLSGDNALVIGAAAAQVPRKQRIPIIVVGGVGAVILRLLLAYLATILLNIPWLQTVGAVALISIAIRLLSEHHKIDAEIAKDSTRLTQQQAQHSFFSKIALVLVADVTMSLDNVLAVGALANGDLLVLTIGLIISLTFLMIGSTLIATVIDRFAWLIDIAALVLAWTSSSMILSDLESAGVLNQFDWLRIALPLFFFAIVLGIDLLLIRRKRRPHFPLNDHPVR